MRLVLGPRLASLGRFMQRPVTGSLVRAPPISGSRIQVSMTFIGKPWHNKIKKSGTPTHTNQSGGWGAPHFALISRLGSSQGTGLGTRRGGAMSTKMAGQPPQTRKSCDFPSANMTSKGLRFGASNQGTCGTVQRIHIQSNTAS